MSASLTGVAVFKNPRTPDPSKPSIVLADAHLCLDNGEEAIACLRLYNQHDCDLNTPKPWAYVIDANVRGISF
jgi:hypothetical protein